MTASDVLRIAGIGIVGAVLSVTLRKQRPELAMLVSAATGVVIFIWLVLGIAPVLRAMAAISGILDETGGFFGVAMKVTGIALVAQFSSRICRDAGEETIAEKIELGGKAIMLAMTVPLLLGMIDLITSFMPAS